MGVLTDHPSYLNTLMKMAVAAELEALLPMGKIDSKPFFFWWQDDFPYITHRLTEDTLVDQSEDQQLRRYVISGRFVSWHVGAGLSGESEELIYAYIPPIETLYTTNHYLLSAVYPNELPEMSPEPLSFKRDTGQRAFDNRGLGIENFPQQLGFEWSLQVDMILDIERRYF